MNVTAVAQPNAASTKNCQGWSADAGSGFPPSRSPTLLVEVSELIVDALLEGRVGRDGFLGRVGLARPLHGGEADRRGPGRPQNLGPQPAQPVEPCVYWRAQHFLAAVFDEKRLDDFVVSLALIDERC